jgi:hypothetical protein
MGAKVQKIFGFIGEGFAASYRRAGKVARLL